MCPSEPFVTSKTLCRVFGVFNAVVGLLILYSWNTLLSYPDKIQAHRWSSLLQLNDEEIRKTVRENCGESYLEEVTPAQFKNELKSSMRLFVSASAIYTLKGLVQFFMTCLNPLVARSISFFNLFLEFIGLSTVLLGLFVFRSNRLCLLEHTDILYYKGQQTLLTVIIILAIATIKLPELIALLFFICEQNDLIAAGETRSKGVRRSEAFITPMNSRVNSFLDKFKGRPNGGGSGDGIPIGILSRFKNDIRKDQNLNNSHQMNSDDDIEEEDSENNVNKKVSFCMANDLDSKLEKEMEKVDETENNPACLDESIRPASSERNKPDLKEGNENDTTEKDVLGSDNDNDTVTFEDESQTRNDNLK